MYFFFFKKQISFLLTVKSKETQIVTCEKKTK